MGNDIIDLNSEPPHPRFYDRITSPQEKLLFDHSTHTALKLWAVKEAAYKACYQRCKNVSGIPKHYEVAQDFSQLRYGESTLQIRLTVTDKYIFSEAFNDSIPRSKITLVTADDQSQSARRAAKTILAEDPFNFDSNDYQILKIGKVPRVILHRGGKLPISLSHHGRFAAASILNSQLI